MRLFSKQSVVIGAAAVFFAGSSLLPLDASARPGGGHGGGHARSSVHGGGHHHANRNVNRNVNRNTNININRPPAGHRPPPGGGHRRPPPPPPPRYGDGRWNHPVGTGLAIAATAAVIGSIVYSLPPSCSSVTVNGVTYQQCGSTWYQPRYSGSTVEYVVIDSPR